MRIVNLTAALTIAALFAASPILAQNAPPPHKDPAFQNPGGVAGGFASTTSKDDATKQKAQSITPPANEDAWEKNKQK
jgi:hypothetical protein